MSSLALGALGCCLLALAAAADAPAIERFFSGAADGRLGFGPALFRGLLAFHGLALLAAAFAEGRRRARGAAPPGAAPPAAPSTWRAPRWALAALALGALCLRLPGLDACLWIDEVFTLLDFGRLPFRELVTRFPSQNQHLLYSVLMFAPLRAFGESPWVVRLPALVFGVATLWPLFRLGRKVLGEREALLACALLAVSPHHVWFSQNARGYTGLLFFATLATWLWLEALDSARERRWWLAYGAALVGGLLTHMTMIFVVMAHGLGALARLAWPGERAAADPAWRSRAAPRAALTFLLAGTLTLQLYALALPEFLEKALHEGSLESDWTDPLWALRESLRSLQLGWVNGAALLAGLVLALAGWLAILRRNADAALLFVLPACLGALSMLGAGHNIWPRFFFFSMGFGLLIAAGGALAMPALAARALRVPLAPRRAHALGAALGVLVLASFASGLPRIWALPKQDFVGARDWVRASAAPGDAVVAVGLAAKVYGPYYAPEWTSTSDAAVVLAARAGGRAVWLVYTQPIYMQDYEPEVWRAIEQHFTLARTFPGTLGGGDVFVCRERP